MILSSCECLIQCSNKGSWKPPSGLFLGETISTQPLASTSLLYHLEVSFQPRLLMHSNIIPFICCYLPYPPCPLMPIAYSSRHDEQYEVIRSETLPIIIL